MIVSWPRGKAGPIAVLGQPEGASRGRVPRARPGKAARYRAGGSRAPTAEGGTGRDDEGEAGLMEISAKSAENGRGREVCSRQGWPGAAGPVSLEHVRTLRFQFAATGFPPKVFSRKAKFSYTYLNSKREISIEIVVLFKSKQKGLRINKRYFRRSSALLSRFTLCLDLPTCR